MAAGVASSYPHLSHCVLSMLFMHVHWLHGQRALALSSGVNVPFDVRGWGLVSRLESPGPRFLTSLYMRPMWPITFCAALPVLPASSPSVWVAWSTVPNIVMSLHDLLWRRAWMGTYGGGCSVISSQSRLLGDRRPSLTGWGVSQTEHLSSVDLLTIVHALQVHVDPAWSPFWLNPSTLAWFWVTNTSCPLISCFHGACSQIWHSMSVSWFLYVQFAHIHSPAVRRLALSARPTHTTTTIDVEMPHLHAENYNVVCRHSLTSSGIQGVMGSMVHSSVLGHWHQCPCEVLFPWCIFTDLTLDVCVLVGVRTALTCPFPGCAPFGIVTMS